MKRLEILLGPLNTEPQDCWTKDEVTILWSDASPVPELSLLEGGVGEPLPLCEEDKERLILMMAEYILELERERDDFGAARGHRA